MSGLFGTGGSGSSGHTLRDVCFRRSPLSKLHDGGNDLLDPNFTDMLYHASIATPTCIFGDVQRCKHNFESHYFGIIYYLQGEHEASDWVLLCELDNGLYALVVASCSITGFEACGEATVYISTWTNIINRAMSQAQYNQYIETTEVVR